MELQKNEHSKNKGIVSSKTSGNKNIVLEVREAFHGVKLAACTDKEVGMLLLRWFAILGVPPENKDGIPKMSKSEVDLLVNYIRRTYQNVTLQEMTLALELAVQGVTTNRGLIIDLNLYGVGFSVAYVTKIVMPYMMYRNKLKRDHESKTMLKMNVYEQGKMPGLSDKQFSTLKGDIDKVGKTREELKREAIKSGYKKVKLDNEDNWQIWMRDFDKLREDHSVAGTGGQFINYAGKIVNREEFCEMKYREMKQESNEENTNK